MNDIHIKCFLMIADKKSFTKAADELYLSQPNISRNITNLENELGVKLFDRNKKVIKLTDAGKVYYDSFKRIQLEFQKAQHKAKLINNNRQGHIRLGYVEGWMVTRFMPYILEKFSKEYPAITISIESYNHKELIHRLKNNQLDVILAIDKSLEGEATIKRRIITEIQKLILYSEYHKLAKKENLTPYDFRNEIFYVLANIDNVITDFEIRKCCEPYGFIPEINFVQNIESMLAPVQNGLGVAIYDEWGRNINTDGFKHVLIDSFHKICMAWNINTTNLAVNVLVNEIYFLMKKN